MLEGCQQGGICFEMAKGAPAALVALVVGAIAAGIAFRQWQVARAKFKLDLFDKRYEIFHTVWGELSIMVQSGPIQPASSQLTNLIPLSQFLFGDDIRDYLHEIAKHAAELWAIKVSISANADIMPPDLAARHAELIDWFYKHASTECKLQFAPYLDFSNWR